MGTARYFVQFHETIEERCEASEKGRVSATSSGKPDSQYGRPNCVGGMSLLQTNPIQH
jgi:hypothetical protein